MDVTLFSRPGAITPQTKASRKTFGQRSGEEQCRPSVLVLLVPEVRPRRSRSSSHAGDRTLVAMVVSYQQTRP